MKKFPTIEKDFKNTILLGIAFTLCFVLVARLFYLQIFKYKSFTERAQYSTSKISILTASRGNIYDRNGKILATNKQSISVIAYPSKINTTQKKLDTYNILSRILKTNQAKLRNKLLKLPANSALPIRLEGNISVAEAIQIVEKQHMLPGINIQQEPVRYYPHQALASHVIGYISEINEKELEKRPQRKIGDLIGKYGVEYLFDDILRGKDGKKIVEVDRFGKPINPSYKHAVIRISPQPGKDIHLTLDLDLQTATERALKKVNKKSAAVVVNPHSGEVLALASYPTFDPNIFTKPLAESTWRHLLARQALLNRAILGYVPGSIWKPITIITALDAMVINPKQRFKVSEALYLGNTRFGDWTDKEDILSLEESLAWSRDTAIYQIGQKLKPKQIKDWGVKLGAGRKTGIELLGEEKGIVPDEEWKKKNLKQPWYPGNTLHYSIGQSFLLVTPTQAARIYSAIANGSKTPKLHLIKQIDKRIQKTPPQETYKLDPYLLKIVQNGLKLCVEKGTCVASKLDNVKVAGKTGSAEVANSKKTHSWFASYAPADKPEVVVVVIAETAGHGGSIAAPIAKNILEQYFDKKQRITNLAHN